MVRLTTFITIVCIAIMALSVYEVEHRVQSLRKEIKVMQKQIHDDKEEIHVLQAEWAYLTRPERLQQLSSNHMEVQPIKASQVITLDQIPFRVQ